MCLSRLQAGVLCFMQQRRVTLRWWSSWSGVEQTSASKTRYELKCSLSPRLTVSEERVSHPSTHTTYSHIHTQPYTLPRMMWLLIKWQRWRVTMQSVRNWGNICMVIIGHSIRWALHVYCTVRWIVTVWSGVSLVNPRMKCSCMLLLLWLCDTTLYTQCLLLSSLSRLFVIVCWPLASSWGLSTRDWRRGSSGHRRRSWPTGPRLLTQRYPFPALPGRRE